jgi:hypothetical protein
MRAGSVVPATPVAATPVSVNRAVVAEQVSALRAATVAPSVYATSVSTPDFATAAAPTAVTMAAPTFGPSTVVQRAIPAEPAVVAAYPVRDRPRWTGGGMLYALQRADEAPSDPVEAYQPPASAEPDVSAPSPSAAPESSQPPAPAPPGPPEPEELLKTLFDPLLRRLRTELRLDRERRGVITDRW